MNKINPKIIFTIIVSLVLALIYSIDIAFFGLIFKTDNKVLFFLVKASSNLTLAFAISIKCLGVVLRS